MSTYQNYPTESFTNLRQIYRANAERYPNKAAFMQKENGSYQSFSYARFEKEIDRLGTALRSKGLANAHILLIGENCYRWILAYMAVACGLGVVVPVDSTLSGEALADLAKTADATAIIYSDKLADKVNTLESDIEKIPFSAFDGLISEGKRLIKSGNRDYIDAPIDPDAMSTILFTSGTSGPSKGVMLSHTNLCFNLSQMCTMVRIESDDLFLSVLPIHHAFECTCGILVPLSKGATVAFAESLRRMMQNMQEIRPTVINCVPMFVETVHRKIWANISKKGVERRVRSMIKMTNALPGGRVRSAAKRKMFASIHKSFGGRLRTMITYGAAANPDVLHGMRDLGIIAIQSYGLTECSPLAAINRDTRFNDHSAGMSMPDGLLDIYDVQNDGTGEIRYKGANVMLGYYKMPELTKEVLHDGWLYTGDLGYLDENGFLYVTGRKKNVIVKASGKLVFPEELELLLSGNPFVKDCVVMGILNRKKNDYDVVAIIRPDIPYAMEVYGKGYTEEQLDLELRKAISAVNMEIPKHKHIHHHILHNESFAKNSSGKILRAPILEKYGK